MMNNANHILNKLCALEVLEYLKTSKLFSSSNDDVDITSLRTSLGVTDQYINFFKFIIQYLISHNLLNHVNNKIALICHPQDFYDSISLDFSKLPLEGKKALQAVKGIISQYHEILSGKSSPLLALFPNGDIDFLNKELAFIINTQDTIFIKNAALEFISTHISNHPQKKILEVGAGAGSLTWTLQSLLKKVDYVFTDISRFFLLRAKRKADSLGLSTMQFSTLDLNFPSTSQGYLNKNYDFILAYNVMHLVEDIPQSINWLYEVLNDAGHLLLLENTRTPEISSLVWGLLPGWWINNENQSNVVNPLLSTTSWKKILKNSKFSSITYHQASKNTDAVLILLKK